MLRLTDSRTDEASGAQRPPRPQAPAAPHDHHDPGAPPPLRFDAAAMAEEALGQAERRMENLLDLVRRFDLDAPGSGPRVA